jgi:hypothetical protein
MLAEPAEVLAPSDATVPQACRLLLNATAGLASDRGPLNKSLTIPTRSVRGPRRGSRVPREQPNRGAQHTFRRQTFRGS